MNENITSLILAIGRCLVGGTSLRAEHTRCMCPWGMNSTQVIGALADVRCADVTKEMSQSLDRNQQVQNVLRQSFSAEGGERLGLGAAEEGMGGMRRDITLCPMVVVEGKEGCWMLYGCLSIASFGCCSDISMICNCQRLSEMVPAPHGPFV